MARRELGKGAQAWPEPPSPAVLCHRQRQWVWGPSGHGAVLLVNCDRDSMSSNDQDNCDHHVRCLQGEGRQGRRPATLPLPSTPAPAGTPAPVGTLPGQSSGEEQPHLPPPPGLESANAEHLLCVRAFPQTLI